MPEERIAQELEQSGGELMYKILLEGTEKTTLEKANILSANSDLCLKVISSLRSYNEPYYSYSYWRFFESCLNQDLVDSLFKESEILGFTKSENVEMAPELLRELLKDYWFTIQQSDVSLSKYLEDLTWLKLAN